MRERNLPPAQLVPYCNGPMSLKDTLHGILHGQEPPPAAIIARQPWYQWGIVGIACTGAFMGQIDASIVQLATVILP
jgi:hypothetical protein